MSTNRFGVQAPNQVLHLPPRPTTPLPPPHPPNPAPPPTQPPQGNTLTPVSQTLHKKHPEHLKDFSLFIDGTRIQHTHQWTALIGRTLPERTSTCAGVANQCSPGGLHVRQMRAQPASMTGEGLEELEDLLSVFKRKLISDRCVPCSRWRSLLPCSFHFLQTTPGTASNPILFPLSLRNCSPFVCPSGSWHGGLPALLEL